MKNNKCSIGKITSIAILILAVVLFFSFCTFVVPFIVSNFEDLSYYVGMLLMVSVMCLGAVLGILLSLFEQIAIPDPAMPEIQYAEFPFEIVYEADGNVYEINDSFVCKLERTQLIPLENYWEKQLEWDTYIKSTGENIVSFGETGGGSDLCLYLGDAEYYMLDKIREDGYLPGEFYYIYPLIEYPNSLKEFEEEYGIKIISTKFSKPLEENKCEYRTIDKIRKVISFPYQLGANVVLNIIEKSEEALFALQQ